jgi:hypothetical protein
MSQPLGNQRSVQLTRRSPTWRLRRHRKLTERELERLIADLSRVISTSAPISALKQTNSACRPAMKRIVWQQTWRGLQGWTYLILDFPVGIRAVGIEVSDQVART